MLSCRYLDYLLCLLLGLLLLVWCFLDVLCDLLVYLLFGNSVVRVVLVSGVLDCLVVFDLWLRIDLGVLCI